jgi:phosphate transport system substrate-binding protein
VDPQVVVDVTGGGSGQGIAALINGSCDLANASRHLEPAEAADLKTRRQVDPKEFLVGYDAMAIIVHPNNPLKEISLETLGEMYRAGGKLTRWSDLGLTIPKARDEIWLISRQNNSGTYHYFREVVVGKKADFRPGSVTMNGSKEVVELIARTPGAIAYTGMGYVTPKVKVLPVSKKSGQPAIAPSVATTLDKTYPLSRPMFIYAAGEPPEPVRRYLDWILGVSGQAVLERAGYIPVGKP